MQFRNGLLSDLVPSRQLQFHSVIDPRRTQGNDCLYKIVVPAGLEGDLLLRTVGELAGTFTTAVTENGRIVGQAGLVPVEDSSILAEFRSELRFEGLRVQINALATQLHQIQMQLRRREEAVYAYLRSRLPDIGHRLAARPGARALASIQGDIAQVKRDVGILFRERLASLADRLSKIFPRDDYEQRSESTLVSNFHYLMNDPVFEAISLLSIAELFDALASSDDDSCLDLVSRFYLERASEDVCVVVQERFNRIDNLLLKRIDQARERACAGEGRPREVEDLECLRQRLAGALRDLLASARPLDGWLSGQASSKDLQPLEMLVDSKMLASIRRFPVAIFQPEG